MLEHGVSFEEASSVFYDPFARIFDDPAHSYQEDQLIIVGMSFSNNLLLISHLYDEKKEEIRIISARKATQKEKKDFEN